MECVHHKIESKIGIKRIQVLVEMWAGDVWTIFIGQKSRTIITTSNYNSAII